MGGKWDDLLEIYAAMQEDAAWAHLRRPGINLVPGDGPESAETARVFVVGEAPGAHENGQRRPFVGASGHILNELLASVGLERRDCFVTNVVKYRPPGNRTPTGSEILQALDTLRDEWSVIDPVLTIAVGSPAQHALSQWNFPHGVLHPFSRGHPDRFVTSVYHPAFGLRRRQAQAWIEAEWRRLGEEIAMLEIGKEIGCHDVQ